MTLLKQIKQFVGKKYKFSHLDPRYDAETDTYTVLVIYKPKKNQDNAAKKC